MKQHSSFVFAIILGIGLSLAPLRAQDNPTAPPQTPTAPSAQPQAWSGDLIDATCKAATPNEKCEVSENTKVFGLQSADGMFYRFDSESNAKVIEALKTSNQKTGAIKVSAKGTAKEGMLTLSTLEIR